MSARTGWIVVALAGVVLAAAADPWRDSVDARLAALEARVAALEAPLQKPPPQKPAATATQRTCRIEMVMRYTLTEQDQARIGAQRERAAAMAKDAASLRGKAERMRGGTVSTRPLRSRAAELEREAKMLEAQTDREIAALSGAYWILGWDPGAPGRDVMLFAPAHLTKVIHRLRVGECIEWAGEVLEVGGASHASFATVRAARLTPVQCAGLQRPPSSEPLWTDPVFPRLPASR